MTTPDHPEAPGVCGWMLLQAGVITPLEEPAFQADEGPSSVITTTNARHLVDFQPGEAVSEADSQKSSKTA